jgi:hypothetical protein
MHFGGGEAVRSGRPGGEQLAREGFDVGGPGWMVGPAGTSWLPRQGAATRPGPKILVIELAEAALRKAQFLGRFPRAALLLAETLQYMPDETSPVSSNQLLILFFMMREVYSTGAPPPNPWSFTPGTRVERAILQERSRGRRRPPTTAG